MRRANLQVNYAGKDISSDIAEYLTSFSYKDNAHGKADTLCIVLEDTKGRFVSSWFPQKGARISAVITCQDWFAAGDRLRLNCGSFEVDQVEFGGPPDVLTINAVSASTTSSIRREKKTKAFENTTLEDVARSIAEKQGLTLLYDSDETVRLARVDQRSQSDLEFLQRQAEAHGLKLKITDDQLVLFDGENADAKPSSFIIKRGDHSLITYRFQTQSHDTYDGAKATYWSAGEKELYAVETNPKKKPKGTGQTLTINERFESQEDAERQAAKRLRAKNKEGTTGTIEYKGHTGMQAGLNVTLSGFGGFDGKYAIETANHKMNGNGGYGTSLELKQALAKDGGEADDSPDFTEEEKELFAVGSSAKTAVTSSSSSSSSSSSGSSGSGSSSGSGTQTMKTPSQMASNPSDMQAGVKQRYQEAVKSGDTAKAESWKKYAAQKGFSVE